MPAPLASHLLAIAALGLIGMAAFAHGTLVGATPAGALLMLSGLTLAAAAGVLSGREDIAAERAQDRPAPETPAFITNDDVTVSRTGTIGVSWDGIRRSPHVHQQFELLQAFRERGVL